MENGSARAKQVSSLPVSTNRSEPAQVQVRQDLDTDNSKLSVQDTNCTTATSLLEPKIRPMSKVCGFHTAGGECTVIPGDPRIDLGVRSRDDAGLRTVAGLEACLFLFEQGVIV